MIKKEDYDDTNKPSASGYGGNASDGEEDEGKVEIKVENPPERALMDIPAYG